MGRSYRGNATRKVMHTMIETSEGSERDDRADEES